MPAPPEPVSRTLASALGLTLVSNFLLWPATPGLSWGLFAVAVGAALALNRPRVAWNRRSGVLALLLLATAGQSAVEISFSNVVVSLALLVALVGELSYPRLAQGWERGSEALWALAKAPGRWIWATGALANLAWTNTGAVGIAFRCLRISLPALVLGAIFARLLGAGNAVFATWLASALATFLRWLKEFDLSIPHLLFYGLLATVALWALRPSAPGTTPRSWTRAIPKLPVRNPSIAWWRGVAILALLNGLFFAVNTIDVFYLWAHSSLPAGVNPSQYVHEGVNSLIAAVILSALVLAALFQQDQGIGQAPALKRLGYVWIAQNFVLIAGVLLRLIRYIEGSRLTEQRVYAISFVLLVAAGFVLLAYHVTRNRGLNWLILSNGLAVFTLFFIMQFLNVEAWVAEYNVARWEREPGATLDVGYLTTLGAPAWPALARVAATKRLEAQKARTWLETRKNEERQGRDWRSWQGRRAFNATRTLGVR